MEKNRCDFCGTIRRGKKNICLKKSCINFGVPQKKVSDFVTLFNFEIIKKRFEKTEEEKIFLKLKEDMKKIKNDKNVAKSFKITIILFLREIGLDETACQLIDDFGLYNFFSQLDKSQ